MTSRGRISRTAGTWARNKALRSRMPRTAGIRPIVHRLRSVTRTMGRSSGSESSFGVQVIRTHRLPGSFDLSSSGETSRASLPGDPGQVQECPNSGRIPGDDEKESDEGAKGGTGTERPQARHGRRAHAPRAIPPTAEPQLCRRGTQRHLPLRQWQALQELPRTLTMDEILENANDLLKKILQLQEHLCRCP